VVKARYRSPGANGATGVISKVEPARVRSTATSSKLVAAVPVPIRWSRPAAGRAAAAVEVESEAGSRVPLNGIRTWASVGARRERVTEAKAASIGSAGAGQARSTERPSGS
jgi:hypothetical protein